MNYDKAALVQYRLEKADQSLEEAHTMAEMEHWDTVANRLYYACKLLSYLSRERTLLFKK